jgi:hypothetical protein
MRIQVFAVFLGVALTGFGCGAEKDRIGKALGDMGYRELSPPSILTPPGTFVVILEDDPLQIGTICTQSDVILPEEVRESSTESRRFLEETSGAFNIVGDALAFLGIDLKKDRVSRISFVLTNAFVKEVPDSVLQRVKTVLKNGAPLCYESIVAHQSRGEHVAIIKSVLQADVTYKVFFEDELDVALRVKAMNDLAATLGGKVSESDQTSIQGTGLFWGVRPDVTFVPGVEPYSSGNRKTVEELFPPGRPIKVVPLPRQK